MARTWLINSRGIAGKVKNASQYSPYQRQECGASLECPNCHRHIDNSDVSVEWPGLPAGVKFDPSDVELLEHLAGKLGLANSKPHMFIDEFIPTLEVDEGICYSHPADLPGAKKDGSSVHFFHRTSKAYATGPRKRRRIQGQCSSTKNHVRWHKTGKTKAVIENGVQKGCKKIMVLYKSSKKGSKPDKSNWVMHQYHLGTNDEETEGEFVVSKIFYQQHPKQTEKNDIDPTSEEPIALAADTISEETVVLAAQTSPRTPNTNTPNPPRPEKRALFDQVDTEYLHYSHAQDAEFMPEGTQLPPEAVELWDEIGTQLPPEAVEIGDEIGTQLPPEAVEIGDEIGTQLPPEAVEIGDEIGAQLPPEAVQLGDEILDSVWWPDHSVHSLLCDEIPSVACSISDLDDLELPDFPFGSQDSIVRWLDGEL